VLRGEVAQAEWTRSTARSTLGCIVDDETLELVRDTVGEQEGIPPRLRQRLRGDSVGAVRADAKRFSTELGLRAEPTRDERGRYASGGSGASTDDAMSDLMRSPVIARERTALDHGPRYLGGSSRSTPPTRCGASAESPGRSATCRPGRQP
jgi:hypothetical protein